MAKGKKNETATEDTEKRAVNPGYKEHHKTFESKGNTMVFDSRPRGTAYRIEEWITPQRQYKLLKVYDDGRIVSFAEEASATDVTAAASNLH